jgi:hypothetical protein
MKMEFFTSCLDKAEFTSEDKTHLHSQQILTKTQKKIQAVADWLWDGRPVFDSRNRPGYHYRPAIGQQASYPVSTVNSSPRDKTAGA